MLFAFIVVVEARLVPGEYLGIHSLPWREAGEMRGPGSQLGWAKPGDKMSHGHPRAWWEWEQECCVLARHMEEA